MGFNLVLALLVGAQSALASLLYIPENLNKETARVVVVIHGCLQSAEAMAAGTGWNGIADKNNLVIIYPQVPEGTNGLNCWSWYLPENQTAKSGQLKTIADDVKINIARLQLPAPQVFATGISSGGAMVAGLAACFPKDFAAVAIHSAPVYGQAKNLEQGNDLLKNGPPRRGETRVDCHPKDFAKPLLVVQGLRDNVVNPRNAQALMTSFLSGAVKENETERKVDGVAFAQTDYFKDKNFVGRLIKIPHLAHAWSGYEKNLRNSPYINSKSAMPTSLPFFATEGPSSTDLIWEFFTEAQQ